MGRLGGRTKRGKRSPLFLGAGDEYGQFCIRVCVCVCVSQLKVDLLKSTNLKIVTLALISAIARLHAGGAV